MLETLVPSRIRRTLLEYILAYPDQRFYLRGLAKELNLSVSPVRRELKRLEELGMLAAHEEGNLRVYVVNQRCPLFLQLKQAAEPGVAAAERALPDVRAAFAGQRTAEPTASVAPTPVDAGTASTPASINTLSGDRIDRIRQTARPPMNWPAMFTAVAMTLMLMVGTGAMVYLVAENYRHVVGPKHTLRLTPVVAPVIQSSVKAEAPAKPAASGEMHSSRWRLTPGTVGGFSTGAKEGPPP